MGQGEQGLPVGVESPRAELSEFLRTRRARRKPADVGLMLSRPLVGELALRYETLAIAGDQEQSLSTYHAKPGSPSEEALRLLASWGADAAQKWTASILH